MTYKRALPEVGDALEEREHRQQGVRVDDEGQEELLVRREVPRVQLPACEDSNMSGVEGHYYY